MKTPSPRWSASPSTRSAPLSLVAVLSFAAATVFAAPGKNHFSARFDLRQAAAQAEWTVGFADYRASQEALMDFKSVWVTDPASLMRGLFLSGSNLSDDLFMFLKRPIYGFKPNTDYRVAATVEFLSRAPTGCVGIGGDPGASVYVKFGATPLAPVPVLQPDGMLRLSVDIGRQSNSGSDALVLGNIATPITDCHNQIYVPKSLATPAPLLARTDASGTLWIFAGADSGFEGITSLYYTQVSVQIDRAHPHDDERDSDDDR